MTELSPAEAAFVAQRERFARYWPLAGLVILLLVTGLVLWLWFAVPHMINPWAVADGLAAGTLPTPTLELMAAMLPVVVLMLCFFAFMVTLLLFASFANERRLVRLIRELDGQTTADQ